MKWNTRLYKEKHNFVEEYGKKLLDYIDDDQSTILDLGCGIGTLTKEISKITLKVIGIDQSPEMIDIAKKNDDNIEYHVMDATQLIWEGFFDVVFSNAVFHWIQNQNLLLKNIYYSLKNNGYLICEFGAKGNIQKIEEAFKVSIEKFGYSYKTPFYFPSVEEYKKVLENNGFNIIEIFSFPRPTPLTDGKKGLSNWVRQFFANDLQQFNDKDQEKILIDIEKQLESELWNGAVWIADYQRIRVKAQKTI